MVRAIGGNGDATDSVFPVFDVTGRVFQHVSASNLNLIAERERP